MQEALWAAEAANERLRCARRPTCGRPLVQSACICRGPRVRAEVVLAWRACVRMAPEPLGHSWRSRNWCNGWSGRRNANVPPNGWRACRTILGTTIEYAETVIGGCLPFVNHFNQLNCHGN
jgi:hypothetical protein